MVERLSSDVISSGIKMIEINRRLITADSTGVINEFYSTVSGERAIWLKAQNEDVQTHTELLESRLPVFSARFEDNGDCLLHVPNGASRVSQLLKFISRDIDGYGEIFEQIGRLNKRLDDQGFGYVSFKKGHSVLDALAYANTGEDGYGGAVFLIPPYSFNKLISTQVSMDHMANDLEQSGYFSNVQIETLLGRVYVGLGEHV